MYLAVRATAPPHHRTNTQAESQPKYCVQHAVLGGFTASAMTQANASQHDYVQHAVFCWRAASDDTDRTGLFACLLAGATVRWPQCGETMKAIELMGQNKLLDKLIEVLRPLPKSGEWVGDFHFHAWTGAHFHAPVLQSPL